jgi:hypothetical protein
MDLDDHPIQPVPDSAGAEPPGAARRHMKEMAEDPLLFLRMVGDTFAPE